MGTKRIYVTACGYCEHARTHESFHLAERARDEHYGETGHVVGIWDGTRTGRCVVLGEEVSPRWAYHPVLS